MQETQETQVRPLGQEDGGGHGSPLQNSCLENPMDRGDSYTTEHIQQALGKLHILLMLEDKDFKLTTLWGPILFAFILPSPLCI